MVKNILVVTEISNISPSPCWNCGNRLRIKCKNQRLSGNDRPGYILMSSLIASKMTTNIKCFGSSQSEVETDPFTKQKELVAQVLTVLFTTNVSRLNESDKVCLPDASCVFSCLQLSSAVLQYMMPHLNLVELGMSHALSNMHAHAERMDGFHAR